MAIFAELTDNWMDSAVRSQNTDACLGRPKRACSAATMMSQSSPSRSRPRAYPFTAAMTGFTRPKRSVIHRSARLERHPVRL